MFYYLLILSFFSLLFIIYRRFLLIKKEQDWQNVNGAKKNEKKELSLKKEDLFYDEEEKENTHAFYNSITNPLYEIDSLIKSKEFKEAEKHLIELMVLRPNDPNLNHKLAKIYIEEGSFNKAQSIYQDLILHYQNPSFFTNLGLCYYVQGELSTALKYYEEALKLDPNRKERFMNVARIYEQMGDNQKVRETYEAWIMNEPRDIDSFIVVANFAEQDKDYEKAIEIYRHILNLSPYNEIAKAKIEELKEKVVGGQ